MAKIILTNMSGSYFLTFIAISLLGCCLGKCIIDERSRCKNFSKELKGLSKLIGNLKTCLKDECKGGLCNNPGTKMKIYFPRALRFNLTTEDFLQEMSNRIKFHVQYIKRNFRSVKCNTKIKKVSWRARLLRYWIKNTQEEMQLPTNIQENLSYTMTMTKSSSKSSIHGTKIQILRKVHVRILQMRKRFKIKNCIISAC
ncbi:uncharacterized protein LOC124435325 [Xenia sp. Carnegie-2017]|uniref:uncharacterized protein LOC124435325 n=1 Tax=Xenia sp. Carnegie-2017 TaxID=2897299 RepID=UPI001F045DB3|nr:uncharacterized protein LOC124435325 [Xenia sp. Carnegie-2017]